MYVGHFTAVLIFFNWNNFYFFSFVVTDIIIYRQPEILNFAHTIHKSEEMLIKNVYWLINISIKTWQKHA